MFSHGFYLVVHILGIALVTCALGGVAVLGMLTGTTARATTDAARGTPRTARRLLAILHGTGAFLILLGGFGMLARLGIVHGGRFPGWIWGKLAIWVLVGAALMVPRRVPRLAGAMLVLLPLLVAVAAYLAVYKPL